MSEEWPRVTHILTAVGLGPDFSGVSEADLSAARDRGTAVHAAIEAHAYGYLDEDAVAPAVAPYLSAYRKFLSESGHEPIASEVVVSHPSWRYRGHVDRVGWLAGVRTLLDWKSGDSVDLQAAALQVTGYVLAWNARRPAEPVQAAAIVNLRSDGTYRLREVVTAEHEQTFLAAVLVYRAQQERTTR